MSSHRVFRKSLIYKDILTEWTGLEPATPGVTGLYYTLLESLADTDFF
jgi:hypothetical protein